MQPESNSEPFSDEDVQELQGRDQIDQQFKELAEAAGSLEKCWKDERQDAINAAVLIIVQEIYKGKKIGKMFRFLTKVASRCYWKEEKSTKRRQEREMQYVKGITAELQQFEGVPSHDLARILDEEGLREAWEICIRSLGERGKKWSSEARRCRAQLFKNERLKKFWLDFRID
jgi:hypothetical protein